MTATPAFSRAPPAASSNPRSAPEIGAVLERILGIEDRLDPVLGIDFERAGRRVRSGV